MANGNVNITVNTEGVAEHLEELMWEIFANIQMRATEAGLSEIKLGELPELPKEPKPVQALPLKRKLDL